METSNTDLERAIYFSATVITVILFASGIKYYGGVSDFLDAVNNFFGFIVGLFGKLATLGMLISIGIKFFVSILFLFLVYKFLKLTIILIADFIEKRIFIKNETIEIDNLLFKEDPANKKDVELEIETLKKKLNFARDYKKLHCFIGKIKKRLEACLKLLREIKKRERLDERQKLNDWITKKNEELDEENRIKATYEDSDADVICCQLRAEDKSVFKKEKLSKNQIKALERKGYRQINEYSVYEHKFIRVLVKPTLNHSKTHTFLVWDTIRLLKDFNGIMNIQEKQTVDADIVFNFHKRKFALEIETGTLLGKKDQEAEKINYLNRKYHKRWMFIVSNKNLLPKYQKLGFATQRSGVLKNLKIMLEKY